MLKIKKLSAASQSQSMLQDINLEVKAGEIHAVMGPKFSGKSALLHSILGHPNIQQVDGSITFNKKKIHDLETDERAKLGIFVGWQFPPEFDNLTNWEIVSRLYSGTENLDLDYTTACMVLDLGFDHGAKHPTGFEMNMGQAKRAELVHMYLSKPSLVLIDEIDVNASAEEVQLMAAFLKDYITPERAGIITTNNQEFLDIIQPTHVHVMSEGEIKLSGDAELYKRIIKDGYPEFSKSN